MNEEVEEIVELYEEYKTLIKNIRGPSREEFLKNVEIKNKVILEIMKLLDFHKIVKLPNGKYLYYNSLTLIELECLNED